MALDVGTIAGQRAEMERIRDEARATVAALLRHAPGEAVA